MPLAQLRRADPQVRSRRPRRLFSIHPQRRQRINPRCSPRRPIPSQRRSSNQQQSHAQESNRIRRPHSIPQPSQHARRNQRHHNTRRHSKKHHPQPLPNHHPENAPARRPQRHPHSDFVRPLRGRKRNHSVNSNRRQHQSGPRETHEQPHDRSRPRRRFLHHTLHRPHFTHRHIRIQPGHQSPNLHRHSPRIRRRPKHQIHRRRNPFAQIHRLRIRHVDRAFDPLRRVASQIVLTDIRHHAHHRPPLLLPNSLDMFAHRIFTRPIPPRRGRAHQHHARRLHSVRIAEEASRQQRNLHHAEIIRRNGASPRRRRHRFRRFPRMILQIHYHRRKIGAQRNRIHRGNLGYSANPAHAPHQFAVKRYARAPIFAKRFAWRNANRKNPLRLKSRIHLRQPPQALDQQSRANNQNHRQRHLARHQIAAQPDSRRAPRSLPARLDSSRQIHARRTQRRH